METIDGISTGRIDRLFADIEAFVDPAFDGWTRTVFSPAYKAERSWMVEEFKRAGLEDVHTDDFGNIVGILPGRHSTAKPIVLGSHTDTVERGGRFDGIVGVLGALEVAQRIKESGSVLNRPLMVIDFFGEEANPFGLTCLGSRALAGSLTVKDLERVSPEGKRLGDAMQSFGLDPSRAVSGKHPVRGSWHAYLELHIEQSSTLDQTGCNIGVVSAIAGIKRLVGRYMGQYDHAGGARMKSRKDALLAAASSALALHEFACGSPEYAVATTTHIDSLQLAQNVVPGRSELRAELRSTDSAWFGAIEKDLALRLSMRATEFGCELDLEWFLDNEIAHTDATLQETIAAASTILGLSWTAVPSGATHDSVHMTGIAPMGMIFIPSIDGRSHCPEEFTPKKDIINGIAVLEKSVRLVDESRP
ncbi:M20 family metallo-hydrolase [Crystallibacter degradans]|uniref:M20 family metallo-hydrolase n=1 Tax=Crystallibacter degradans TaxID=2726743 RepID=UPI001474F219|nr:M20 family metallo-hydrolase [Arthrobacter sp. SF27]NMR29126.1 M20 family metallo-hydrolase [Arthrobacter sp. SF27]